MAGIQRPVATDRRTPLTISAADRRSRRHRGQAHAIYDRASSGARRSAAENERPNSPRPLEGVADDFRWDGVRPVELAIGHVVSPSLQLWDQDTTRPLDREHFVPRAMRDENARTAFASPGSVEARGKGDDAA